MMMMVVVVEGQWEILSNFHKTEGEILSNGNIFFYKDSSGTPPHVLRVFRNSSETHPSSDIHYASIEASKCSAFVSMFSS
jgi:hypothetical protein